MCVCVCVWGGGGGGGGGEKVITEKRKESAQGYPDDSETLLCGSEESEIVCRNTGRLLGGRICRGERKEEEQTRTHVRTYTHTHTHTHTHTQKKRERAYLKIK